MALRQLGVNLYAYLGSGRPFSFPPQLCFLVYPTHPHRQDALTSFELLFYTSPSRYSFSSHPLSLLTFFKFFEYTSFIYTLLCDFNIHSHKYGKLVDI